MTELIPISTLNDSIFCPYSIYLHNVYMDTDEGNYHAIPQTRGKNAHSKVDSKSTSTSADIIESLPVISHELCSSLDMQQLQLPLLINIASLMYSSQ